MERFRKLGTQDMAHKGGVWSLAATTANNRDDVGHFATAGCDSKLRTWRIKSDKELIQDADEDGVAQTASAGPCVQLGVFSGHSLPVVGLAVAKSGGTAASTSMDGSVRVWNLANPETESKSVQHLNIAEMWGIDLSWNGQRAVTGGVNGTIKIMDTTSVMVDETYTIVQEGNGKDGGRRDGAMVMSIALSADEAQIAAGGHDGSVSLLDVETGKLVGNKLAKHGGPVRSLSYMSSEPTTLVTGSDDHLINLYDVRSGQVTGTCKGHVGLVFSAEASEDGKYLVSGGSDRCVHVWDRMLRESVYSFKGHKDSVWGVCYALGRDKIVSASDDGCIGVLDSSNADNVA